MSILVILALVALAFISTRLGVDNRGVNDHRWDGGLPPADASLPTRLA